MNKQTLALMDLILTPEEQDIIDELIRRVMHKKMQAINENSKREFFASLNTVAQDGEETP